MTIYSDEIKGGDKYEKFQII